MAQHVTPLFGSDNHSDLTETQWLTAAQIVARTGISKTDLIRFIQLKALPEAMIRFAEAGPDGSRRVSAFSSAILEPVARLQQLRDAGQSVEAIAAATQQAADSDHSTEHAPQTDRHAPAHTDGFLHLPRQSIFGSAFFIDPALHLAWVKVTPEDRLFGAIRDEFANNPSGTVFDILLRASLKELVFDWQPLFSFIYRFLRETTPAVLFSQLAPVIELPPHAIDLPDKNHTRPYLAPPLIDSCPIRIADESGQLHPMRLYAIALSEGTLCLYETTRGLDAQLGLIMAAAASGAPEDHVALKTAFGVLSARIDNSQHIVETLLPDTYFQIMTRIWEVCDEIAAGCGGQRVKRSGTDVQYVIPQLTDIDPAFEAIRCAVALQQRIDAINRLHREEGGWIADIRLNIGISSGRDHLPKEDPSASMAFMLPGGAADQAQHLSAIGQDGAVLITKSAFGHLSPDQMDRITFGIVRDDHLIPRTFAQVADISKGPDSPSVSKEIRSLFITRIMELKEDDPKA